MKICSVELCCSLRDSLFRVGGFLQKASVTVTESERDMDRLRGIGGASRLLPRMLDVCAVPKECCELAVAIVIAKATR